MRSISLNLHDELLLASARHSAALGMTRAEYIRRAIDEMNQRIEASLRAKRMRAAALKCREQDLKVNAEFAAMEHDLDDAAR